MSTALRTSSYISSSEKDFREQLKRPRFPLILTKDGLQGVIVQSVKGIPMQHCEAALDSLVSAGLIQRHEHFCNESNGTFLFLLLRPIRSSSAGARKDQG